MSKPGDAVETAVKVSGAAEEREGLLAGEPAPVEDKKEDEGLDVPLASVYLVFFTIFIDTLGASISTPVLPFYAKKFDVTDAYIGYLYASWSGASTLCVPLMGYLADRWGRKNVLVLSLVGAGVAAWGQGLAWVYGYNYWVFFAFRAMSGCFAAVGSTAQVYLSDVCKDPQALKKYQARLASVAPAALTFGFGIGGGLSKLGLNVPICVDGGLALCSSLVVSYYLLESPAWQRARGAGGAAAAARKEKPAAPCNYSVVILAASGLFWGVGFSAMVSMFGLWGLSRWDLDALHVGFIMVAGSVIGVVTNVWVTTRVQDGFGRCCGGGSMGGVKWAAIFGQVVYVGMLMGQTYVPNTYLHYVWGSIAFSVIGRCFLAWSMPGRAVLVASVTEPKTRGTIMGRVQMFTNLGRFIGPLMFGNIAGWGAAGKRTWGDPDTVGHRGIEEYVWWIAAGSWVVASLLMALIPVAPAAAPGGGPRHVQRNEADGVSDSPLAALTARQSSSVAGQYADEAGTEDEERELGRWLAQLLRERHYKWASEPAEIRRLLARVIPRPGEDDHDYVADIGRLFGGGHAPLAGGEGEKG